MENNNSKTIKNLEVCPNCGKYLFPSMSFDREKNVYLFFLRCMACKFKTHFHFIGIAGLTVDYPGDKIEGETCNHQ